MATLVLMPGSGPTLPRSAHALAALLYELGLFAPTLALALVALRRGALVRARSAAFALSVPLVIEGLVLALIGAAPAAYAPGVAMLARVVALGLALAAIAAESGRYPFRCRAKPT